ncbi:hypothetical protein Q0M94_11865 [Deinococcus radiomollis]|uniref:hypothetical protein n=1 Tax=Deinococcus radiomollis TaxID=468916 RepID=UPI0038917B75
MMGSPPPSQIAKKFMSRLGITSATGDDQRAGNVLDYVRNLLGTHERDPDVHGLSSINEQLSGLALANARLAFIEATRTSTVVSSSTFTGADRALAGYAAEVGGQVWAALFGLSASITGNKVTSASGSGYNILPATVADGVVSMNFTLAPNGAASDVSLYFRFDDSSNYGLFAQRGTGVLNLIRQLGGPTQIIASLNIPNALNGASALPENLALYGSGKNIIVVLNGTPVYAWTENFVPATIAKHGLRLSAGCVIPKFRVLSGGTL